MVFPLYKKRVWVKITWAFALCFFAQMLTSQAQLLDVIVEPYYVSDANDATDEDGGGLTEGSVTYRVFVQLAEGSELTAIYGNENHPLIIESTTNFFNNADRGEIFGFEIGDNRIDENTVALDSWLSMGGATGDRFGIAKENDTDGSLVGGDNNDGGSEGIPGGLLVNDDPVAGIPLTESDGLIVDTALMTTVPDNLVAVGDDLGAVLGDETISGSFVSTNFTVQSSGISSAATNNSILIAQLTTSGELSFEFNIRVRNAEGDIMKYVAGGDTLLPDEQVNPLLKYPRECGCTDPAYLEYDPYAGCDDGSCETLIVFGCLNPEACNYDPDANFDVPELCCFLPDSCQGLDPALVCEGVGLEELEANAAALLVYPNPTRDQVNVEFTFPGRKAISYVLYDAQGRVVAQKQMGEREDYLRLSLELSTEPSGLYVIRFFAGNEVLTQSFIKE